MSAFIPRGETTATTPRTRPGQPAVLIVDDRRENRVAMEAVLGHLRCRIVSVASPDEALGSIAKEEFAVILLDVQMPGMTGFELARAIREQQGESAAATTPIIFLTASEVEADQVEEAYALGAADYLIKPVHNAELVSKVQVFLDLYSARQRAERHAQAYAELNAERRARELAEEALEAAELAKGEAQRANSAKNQFLAMMSHELRTPLNAIIGYAELLDLAIPGPINVAQRQFISRVRASAQHLLSIVNDVLDLAKVEAGRIHVARDLLSASDAVRAALALVRPQAVSRGVSITNDCADGDDVVLLGDEGRVRQILANLLSNAVKFTPSGGRVTASCGADSNDDRPRGLSGSGSWSFIRVEDTGLGIPADRMDAIFQPFLQLDSGLTRTKEGAGLGLTISRRLARMMGGELSAASEEGHGSTFTLWLPSKLVDLPLPSVDEAVLAEPITPNPPTDDTYAALRSVGERLLDEIDTLASVFVGRLRAHPDFPQARNLSDVQLRNHATTWLADIASSLVLIGETRDTAGELLRHGSQIQRLIAELHGAQRQSLGWTERLLGEEVSILGEEVANVIKRLLPKQPEAAAYAAAVTRRFLDQGEEAGRLGFRFAAAAAREG